MPGRRRGRRNGGGASGYNDGRFGVGATPILFESMVPYDAGDRDFDLAADEWPSLPVQEATTRLANFSLVDYEDKKASYLS